MTEINGFNHLFVFRTPGLEAFASQSSFPSESESESDSYLLADSSDGSLTSPGECSCLHLLKCSVMKWLLKSSPQIEHRDILLSFVPWARNRCLAMFVTAVVANPMGQSFLCGHRDGLPALYNTMTFLIAIQESTVGVAWITQVGIPRLDGEKFLVALPTTEAPLVILGFWVSIFYMVGHHLEFSASPRFPTCPNYVAVSAF